MYNQELLYRNNFHFIGHPDDYRMWLAFQGKDKDCYVTVKTKHRTLSLKVEFKYLGNDRIIGHPSWIVRDWITRDADIIVTNNKWFLSYDERKMIKDSGKLLFDCMEFLNYLYTLTHHYVNYECIGRINHKNESLKEIESENNLLSWLRKLRKGPMSGILAARFRWIPEDNLNIIFRVGEFPLLILEVVRNLAVKFKDFQWMILMDQSYEKSRKIRNFSS